MILIYLYFTFLPFFLNLKIKLYKYKRKKSYETQMSNFITELKKCYTRLIYLSSKNLFCMTILHYIIMFFSVINISSLNVHDKKNYNIITI